MIDRSCCPLCGRPNGCVVEAGGDPRTCWCMTVKVPAELRERSGGRGACICRLCVEEYLTRKSDDPKP